jgi:hypothetical protein
MQIKWRDGGLFVEPDGSEERELLMAIWKIQAVRTEAKIFDGTSRNGNERGVTWASVNCPTDCIDHPQKSPQGDPEADQLVAASHP